MYFFHVKATLHEAFRIQDHISNLSPHDLGHLHHH